MNKKKYIILGLTPQGLAILRELGRAGMDVTAFCTSKRNVGYHSRYGKKKCYQNISELKNGISQIADAAYGKPVCYITSGEILASVLREYKELYDECEVYSGPYPVIEMLTHKDKMYECAIEKGFKVARYATLDKAGTADLVFPLFLKRNYEIPLFFKAVKVETPDELRSYIDRIPEESLKDVIVQEYINIPDSNLVNISCQGFFVTGKCAGIYVAEQKRKLRKGITSYIEEITDKELYKRVGDLASDFMKELKYCGFAEFEFMYDKENKDLWFVEINTRPCGSQSGMSHKFNNLQCIILNPEKYVKLQPAKNQLKWMNIQRDIRTRLESGDWKHFGDIFRAKYDILNWKDPMPFFRQFI